MPDRRETLSWITASAVAAITGCGRKVTFDDTPFDFPVVDAHAHFFNGRDIPPAGFLERVLLRDAHDPVPPYNPIRPLLRFLEKILLQGTEFAKDELNAMQPDEPRVAAVGTSDAQDRRAVRRALENLGDSVFASPAAASPARAADQAERAALFDTIAAEAGEPTAAMASGAMASGAMASGAMASVRSSVDAQQVTAAIYEKREQAYVQQSRLIQTIRWAGLLTRSRREIIAEYSRLYAGAGRVRIVAPALVDFELWFPRGANMSPIADQVEVMAAIAQDHNSLLILNFLGFCPIRAALEAKAGRDPLALVRHAVESRGFAGVKLYPPLSFLPLGNPRGKLFGPQGWPRVTGAAIDQVLTKLYDWCNAEAVPIMAHADNGNQADVCSGLNASPANWARVIEHRRSIRLNLAHFGEFEETNSRREPGECPSAGPTDWEVLFGNIARTHPGVYGDLGYWIEAQQDAKHHGHAMERLKALVASNPLVSSRLMFGTDWVMLGREPAHPAYLPTVRQAVAEVGLDTNDIFHRNALRFLGLVGNPKQAERLSRFFGEGRIQRASRL